MNYIILGQYLKKARTEANISQADIAAQLDVTPQNVSSWERGKSKIDIDSFFKLCSMYQVDPLPIMEAANGTNLSEPPQIEKEEELSDMHKKLISNLGKMSIPELLAIEAFMDSLKNVKGAFESNQTKEKE